MTSNEVKRMDIVIRLREGRTDGSDLRWTPSPEHLEAADEIERLRFLLKDADKVVIWEHTAARQGFQEEIEAALGIQ